ncbi:unnamed protein product, partial [Rotaria sp. Silwood1]
MDIPIGLSVSSTAK